MIAMEVAIKATKMITSKKLMGPGRLIVWSPLSR
jgi:hypothetical protein